MYYIALDPDPRKGWVRVYACASLVSPPPPLLFFPPRGRIIYSGTPTPRTFRMEGEKERGGVLGTPLDLWTLLHYNKPLLSPC